MAFTATTDARYVERPVPLLRPDRRQPARHRRVGRRRVPRPDRDRGGARDRRVDGMNAGANGTAIRAATDVGGTFTDLVYFSTDPETGVPGGRHGEVRHDAARLRAGRARRAAQGRRRRSARSRSSPTARRVVINALDRAQGRQDRADHDRGLPRLARDRARQPARLLQPALREAGAVRAALPAARGARAARPRRARSARRSTSPACPRSSTTSAPEGVEAVAICLLHSYAEPAPRAGRARRACASSGRRSRSSRRTRSRREWREYERTSTAVLSAYVQPVGRALPAAGSPTGSSERRLRRPALRHAVELRRRLGREDQGDPDHDGRVGAGQRLLGRGRARPADRRAERARARHRRDDGEVLADRGRRT